MFVTGHGGFLSSLVNVYMFVIFVYVLASWIPETRYQGWYRALGSVCEPYLSLFRKLVPPMGGFDLSPMIGFFVLMIIAQILSASGM
jgi:YggT family protein